MATAKKKNDKTLEQPYRNDDESVSEYYLSKRKLSINRVCSNDDAKGIAQRMARNVARRINAIEGPRYMRHSPDKRYHRQEILEELIRLLEEKV